MLLCYKRQQQSETMIQAKPGHREIKEYHFHVYWFVNNEEQGDFLTSVKLFVTRNKFCCKNTKCISVNDFTARGWPKTE